MAQKDVRISLNAKNQPVQKVLELIKRESNYRLIMPNQFYNPDSLVTIAYQDQKTSRIIKKLFNGKAQTKIVGNEIIVLPKFFSNKPDFSDHSYLEVSGIVIDQKSRETLREATIYQIEKSKITLTDKAGGFVLPGTRNKKHLLLYIARQMYSDTIIQIDPKNRENLVIPLQHKEIPYFADENLMFDSPIEQLMPKFVSKKILKKHITIAKNLQNVNEKKIAQISFLPFLSTNGHKNGITGNNFSLNIIGGFNGSISGIEIGGGANLIYRNASGLQAAGLFNWVNRDVSGLQIAGGFNNTYGDLQGMQFGGIFNYNREQLHGFQLAGIGNIVRSDITGMQMSSVYNHSCRTVKGIQLAGIFNSTIHTLKGLQLGMVNYAGNNKGLQLGLLNIADSTNGISIGLFNYSKSGYRSFALSANEIFPVNVAFRSGSTHFYTLFNFSIGKPEKTYLSMGTGMGTQITFRKSWIASIDATANMLHEDGTKDWGDLLWYRLGIDGGYQISEKITLAAGPAINLLQVGKTSMNDIQDATLLNLKPINEKEIDPFLIQLWIGGQIELQYRF